MDLCDSQRTGEDHSQDRSPEDKQLQKEQDMQHGLPKSVAVEVVEFISKRYPEYSVVSILTAALKHLQSFQTANSEIVHQSVDKINEAIERVAELDEKKEVPVQPAQVNAPPARRRGRPPKVIKETNGQTLPREVRERKIAQIYLQSGYGIGPAKEQAGFQVDLNFYYTSMRNIMYAAFKKLQNIAQTICRVNVQHSQDHKSQKFKNELCKCEKWMSTDELSTFHEYIKSVYDLQPRAVSKGQTVRLFNSLIGHWSKVPH